MRKMRKQVSGVFDPRNFDLEPGQRVYSNVDGKVYDLYESTGRNKSSSGELSYREPKSQKEGKIAENVNGVWFWK